MNFDIAIGIVLAVLILSVLPYLVCGAGVVAALLFAAFPGIVVGLVFYGLLFGLFVGVVHLIAFVSRQIKGWLKHQFVLLPEEPTERQQLDARRTAAVPDCV
jgi:hypothetical protein